MKHLPQSLFTGEFFQIMTFGIAFYQSNLSAHTSQTQEQQEHCDSSWTSGARHKPHSWRCTLISGTFFLSLFRYKQKSQIKLIIHKSWPKWHSEPFQGPKKSRFLGPPPPQIGPCYGFAPPKNHYVPHHINNRYMHR